MKMILRCLILALLFHTIGVHAQRKPRIKGNRTVTAEVKTLPSFSGIEIKDDLDVVIRRGTVESYTVTADENLIDILKFEVEDNTLVISSFYQITAKKELSITISYTQLNSVVLNDGSLSTAEGEKINSEQLDINTLGVSRISLDADVGELNINMQDNSKGNFTFTADSLSVKLRQKANAQIYVNSFSNTADVTENAVLQIEGTANTLDLILDGNARLRAEDLEIGELSASLSGSADARLFVMEKLQLNLSGTSRCYLYGEPVISLNAFKDNAEFFKRNK